MALELSLDIETTGLDPQEDEVLLVGFGWPENKSLIYDDWSESAMLVNVANLISSLPQDTVIYSWNGASFDYPFLYDRMKLLGINDCAPALEPTGKLSKYNKVIYDVTWGDVKHVDIAPAWKSYADRWGIKHSLKAVGRHRLDYPVLEMDFDNREPVDIPMTEFVPYLESDLRVTRDLGILTTQE